MPSGKRNLIAARVKGLIFQCSMLLQLDTCLLVYHSMYNAFFIDLLVSFVSHSSLLTVKGVDLVVAHDLWLPFIMEIVHFFIVATLIVKVIFEQFLIRNAV